MRIARINFLPVVLIVLLAILQYRFWFQAGGMHDMLELKKQVSASQAENDKLTMRNNLLLQQVELLQKNTDAIEARARQELGMVKKGETYYQITK
jgi:cell division protein FtsB